MVYVRSVLAGMVALIIAALVFTLFFGGPVLKELTRPIGGELTDTYFVVLRWHLWPTFGISLLVFLTGFYWQYRRTRRTR
jgi:hypothetical protein